ncbi:MAG: helix-turn-helix transcriptional regulator [Ruminiclostridium sp.]|nr:helix-turn-helix transcriptional regulator [Ruminiclostridium sp.]
MNRTIYPVICRQTELPFYLTEAGIYEPGDIPQSETACDRFAFLFTEHGSGRLIAGGCGYSFKKGSIAYIAPGTEYRYESTDGGSVKRFVFGGEDAQVILARLGFGNTAVKTELNLSECSRIFDSMLSAAEDPIHGDTRASLLIYEFILAVRSAAPVRSREPGMPGDPAEEALRYIDENYMRDITLETLAGLTGVTLQHFCRVFRDRTGMRPMEYLAKKRISEAKKLLDCTDMQIQDIGQAVGIADRNYFGITFKKYEGITPTEHRRQRQI